MEAKIEKSKAKGRRIPVPAKVAIVWIGVYLFLKFFIRPPLPFSLIFMYMALTLVGILIYVSIYEDNLREFIDPIREFLVGDRFQGGAWKTARMVVLILIPLYIGYLNYQSVSPKFEPPVSGRTIHPAPPVEVTGFANPLRQEANRFEEYMKDGARIYFENCVFCHGDRFDGKGIFAHGFNLRPADFADQGTIAQLQESYVFWRISTGGPGLPDESTPWDSAMPKWSDMLSEEDRWKVTMYIYYATGWTPRTWE